MRIISGKFKNRSLASPEKGVRPTSDKVRGALFSSLQDVVSGAKVLDIFAGSGAVGIEAMSRGASSVTFVEKSTDALTSNVKLLESGSYRIINKDFFKVKLSGSFDFIFIDPPYGEYPVADVIKIIFENNLLADNGILVYEESSRLKIDFQLLKLELFKDRVYGDTALYYFKYFKVEIL